MLEIQKLAGFPKPNYEIRAYYEYNEGVKCNVFNILSRIEQKRISKLLLKGLREDKLRLSSYSKDDYKTEINELKLLNRIIDSLKENVEYIRMNIGEQILRKLEDIRMPVHELTRRYRKMERKRFSC